MADMISDDYILVNGVSSATVGLWVDTPPVPPMARQRVTTWQTGGDMDVTAPDDAYEDIKIPVSAYVFFRRGDFDLSRIYAFLSDAKTLQLSRFANRFFKVRSVDGITPQAQYDGQRIKIAIAFTCAPFKYHVSNGEITPSGTVENPGTRYARPVYKIMHSGGCTLTVNGEVLTVAAGASSPIFVDAERMAAYDQNGAVQTQHTAGLYPFLQPGLNTVSTTATVLTVTGNWRDY